MMVDPMFMIVQNSRLFLTAVIPIAVAPTAVILTILIISHKFRHSFIMKIMILQFLSKPFQKNTFKC